MRKIFVSLLIAMLISSISFAADFAPTLLKLTADPIIQYSFDGSELSIPVQVSGTPAGIIFCVFTKGEAANIPWTMGGYLGWHHVDKIDTCLYYSTLQSVSTGANTVVWDGKDQDGGVVPAGEYTYYLWAFDNQGAKQKMTDFITMNYRTFNFQEVDESGLPMSNPLFYSKTIKWRVGSDPMDSTLLEECTLKLATDWGSGDNACIEKSDFSSFYVGVKNKTAGVAGIQKFKWVPGGEAEVQSDWGDAGYSELFSTLTDSHMPIVVSDNDYLFTVDMTYHEVEAVGDFYIYDLDGYVVDSVDIKDWWCDPADLEAGAQMCGGPDTHDIRNNKVFLNCHCSCINQMVDPYRYLDSGDAEDLFVWTNRNGDYVLDHNYEETAERPWVCMDYAVGPYKYNITADDNLFSAVVAYDAGAVSFGLYTPDGSGVGYLCYAGETAGNKKSTLFIDSDTPFDGIYCDNMQTGGPHYEWDEEKADYGMFFVGHDSIKGIITSTSGPYLSLYTPRGGELLERGMEYNISWSSYDVDFISVEYSTNNGMTWNTIAGQVSASERSFSWRVPSVISDNCFIKITDVNDSDVSDRNDSPFSIVMPDDVQEYYILDVEKTGNNATVIIEVDNPPEINGEPIEIGDNIGIFTPRGLCAGAAVWSGINLAMTIWGDDTVESGTRGFVGGEVLTFKIWDKSDNKEYVVNATFSTGTSIYSTDGLYVISKLENQAMDFNIPLSSRWNLISLPFMVSDYSMESVLSSVMTHIVVVKNGAGNVFWPEYQINTIGEWDILDGYQLYTDNSCTLSLSGYELFVPDVKYSLDRGWNLISYISADGLSPESAFESILDILVLVKDGNGNVFWPEYNIDNIGQMYTGNGYWIYLTSPIEFNYPMSAQKVFAISSELENDYEHFSPVDNTGNNATILIKSGTIIAEGITLNNGDEIGVLAASGMCVGAVSYQDEANMAITIWGDDSLTDEVDGLKQGESFNIVYWDSDTQKEYVTSVIFESGTATYASNAFMIVKNINVIGGGVTGVMKPPITFSLNQNRPNPFNPVTSIPFTIPHETHVTLRVYDISGRSVKILADGVFPAGKHYMKWDAAGLASGLYFCRMKAGEFTDTIKITVVK